MSLWRSRKYRELEDLLRKKKLKKELEPILFIDTCYECDKPIIKNVNRKTVYQLGCKCGVPHEYYFMSSGKHRWRLFNYRTSESRFHQIYSQAQTIRRSAQIDIDVSNYVTQAAQASQQAGQYVNDQTITF